MTLTEQKKLLVKEVKQCRKKIEGLSEALETEKAEKEQLSVALSAVEQKYQDLRLAMSQSEGDGLITKLAESFIIESREDSRGLDNPRELTNGHESAAKYSYSNLTNPVGNPISSTNGNDSDVDINSCNVVNSSSSSSSVSNENHVEEQLGKADSLSSYDWLTEEQRYLALFIEFKRIFTLISVLLYFRNKIILREASEASAAAAATLGTSPEKKTSLLSKVVTSFVPGNKRPSISSSSPVVSSTVVPSPDYEDSGQSLPNEVMSAEKELIGSHTHMEPTPMTCSIDNVESSASERAFVPTCYRCGGTVEGPFHSTCKCKIPAMCPEDVKRGRGLVGGLMDAFRSNSDGNSR